MEKPSEVIHSKNVAFRTLFSAKKNSGPNSLPCPSYGQNPAKKSRFPPPTVRTWPFWARKIENFEISQKCWRIKENVRRPKMNPSRPPIRPYRPQDPTPRPARDTTPEPPKMSRFRLSRFWPEKSKISKFLKNVGESKKMSGDQK